MRKVMNSLTILLLLAILIGGDSSAHDVSPIPSSYSQTDFLLTTPGESGNALGGFVNPAAYGLLPGFENQLHWSDDGARLGSLPRWGFFMGLPHLGFGVVHRREYVTAPGQERRRVSITDYRLAMAGGERSWAFGVGYGWSKGDVDVFPRDDLLQVGMIVRPRAHISAGLAGDFALSSSHRKGIFDLAMRPLGTPLVTLFGDAELMGRDQLEDALWGVGVAMEPLPGVQLVGKYRDDETISLGVTFSFGRSTLSVAPRYDADGNLSYTLYGARSGYPTDNIFDRYLKRDKRYLSLNLKGRVGYRKFRYFDKESHTLSDILAALDAAIADPRVGGVGLNLSGMTTSRVLAWEIRQKLQELRGTGKKVIIFFDQAGMTEYHLASVADRIVMDPEGFLYLAGYRSGRTFYKGTVEKLGLGIDILRFYKYKSAGEMFSREDMSAEDREQSQALVDDRYELVRSEIAASRGISAATFDSWINEGFFFHARMALEQGQVDTLARWTDIEDIIASLEGQKKKMVGPSGMAAREFPCRTWGPKPKIAVVYALGFCAMDWGIEARQLEKIFADVKDDRSIKAVVFRVDSPGGEARASDVVAEAMKKCAREKPMLVSQGGVAASGGYHISMYADTIVAAPNTVTGSIGVLGGWLWDKSLGTKLGMTSDHVKVGHHADLDFGIWLPLLGLELPSRPLRAEERARFEEIIRDGYRLFVSQVAQGRGMTEDAVEAVAQGRVWSGAAGKEVGLVDEIGGLDRAIRLAREAAGLAADEEIEIVEMPQKGLFKTDLFKPGLVSRANFEKDPHWQYLKLFCEHPGQPLRVLAPELYEADR